MNNMKKLASLLLALVMVLAMAAPAMAATITITGGANGSEYAAYKLLNVTDGGEGKFAYTLNENYTTILQTVTGKTEQTDIVEHIDALDADGIRAFADAVYAEITAANPAISADYTTANNEFAEVDQGYYLIAETKVGDAADTFSLVMLDTAGKENIEVSTKESAPTLDKEIQEKNDTTGASSWGETADYDIGDEIEYRINGTVSSKYADYGSYYYSIKDTMEDGLSLKSEKAEGSETADYTVSIKVTIDDADVTNQFDIEATEHAFSATANLKELTGITVTAQSKVQVTYTAILNENAKIGAEGNKNTAHLEFENNPYVEADGKPETNEEPENPGETPDDICIVFTFTGVVNKVDKDGTELPGAGFTLYKNVADEWVAVEVITDDLTVTGDVVKFEFKGLDVGKYKLVETQVPAGYNKADDIEFEIVATYEEKDLDLDTYGALTDLKVMNGETEISAGDDATFGVNIPAGEVSTDVVNSAGATLPETGGMGTTMIYVIGCLMVAGAAIVLFAKKRAAK